MRHLLPSNTNCIDIGCYRGDVLRDMLQLAPHGRHYAFEPTPDNYRYLSQQFTSVKLINVALSNYSSVSEFQYVIGRTARNGLRKVAYPQPSQETAKIHVMVDRLDNIVPPDAKIGFVKLDVEGAELDVLRGAANLLQKDRPLLVFEHDAKMAKVYDADSQAIYEYLSEAHSYRLSPLRQWAQHRTALSKKEFLKVCEQGLTPYFFAFPD